MRDKMVWYVLTNAPTIVSGGTERYSARAAKGRNLPPANR